jgi:hypothetical protein
VRSLEWQVETALSVGVPKYQRNAVYLRDSPVALSAMMATTVGPAIRKYQSTALARTCTLRARSNSHTCRISGTNPALSHGSETCLYESDTPAGQLRKRRHLAPVAAGIDERTESARCLEKLCGDLTGVALSRRIHRALPQIGSAGERPFKSRISRKLVPEEGVEPSRGVNPTGF